jgi:hypothetical protein
MSLPAIALKQAIRTALLADAGLIALLGTGGVFDEVPRGRPTPFIVFGETSTRDASTTSGRAHETTLTIFALSGAGGQLEAQKIAAMVENLLHDASLVLAGHRLINLTLIASESRRERNLESTRATLRFRAYTERI